MATLNETLRVLPARIATEESDAVWAHLESLATRLATLRPDTAVDARGLLMRAIDVIKVSDPKGTLALIDFARSAGHSNAKLEAVASSCLDRIGDHAEAKRVTAQLVADKDADPESKLVAANLLVRYGESESALIAALEAYEALGRPLKHTATVLYITQRCADFYQSQRLTKQITDAYLKSELARVNESPRTNLLWSADEQMNIAVTSLWAKNALPKDQKVYQGTRPAMRGRKLTIGYLSSDFREHPTLRLMMGALRNHNKSKFNIVLICSGWDDDSAIRKEAVALCDRVIQVTDLPDDKAADLIKAEGIDVLVELNGPTRANRLAILPHRPAPVQIDYLGWAGSIGGVGVDYVVGDNWTVPPGAEALYPERVMRMDPTYQINDHAAFLPVQTPTKSSVGLPEDRVVLGVFNAVNKIQGDVWRIWMQLLKALPNTVLWLLDPGEAARKRLGRYAAHYGVDVKRIIGAQALRQADHLARIGAADLMIDPWPYGGHTSTSDALYAGVPVVTINGKNYPGRVSAGLLRAAGLPELVARDPNDYCDKIIALVKDSNLLQQYKHALKQVTQTTAFNAKARTEQLEALYTQAYQAWELGEPARHITANNRLKPQPRLVDGLTVTVDEATIGYGSSPDWVRSGEPPRFTKSLSHGEADQYIAKPKAVLVLGPWSSGTSAVAQVAEALGATLVGDMFKVNDPKTQTYEMLAFRSLLLTLADEKRVARISDDETATDAINAFAQDHAISSKEAMLLKHPLAAFFLPQLEQAFDLKILAVMRPLDAIEQTRVRRKWPAHFGRLGAERVYLAMQDALASSQAPLYWVKYPRLIDHPTQTVSELATFLGMSSDERAIHNAIGRIRR